MRTARPGRRRGGPGRAAAAAAAAAAVAAWLLGPVAAWADPAPAPADPESLTVALGTWRAEALGRVATGAAGWVAACDGALRLDLELDAQPDEPGRTDRWTRLLARDGRGWTLVATPVGEGLYGAWDREWKAPPAGLAALARGVVRWSGMPPPSGRGESFVLAAAGLGEAPQGPAAGADLRRDLASRARGGGGVGEVVRIRPAATGGVAVRSSRRPGRLLVEVRERRPLAASPGDVFLPWWSLGEILAQPAPSEPGTSPDQAR